MMYDSLQKKIVPLLMMLLFTRHMDQAVPAVKTSDLILTSTIGDEKKFNYALKQQTEKNL